jgi:hypothetical protein
VGASFIPHTKLQAKLQFTILYSVCFQMRAYV